ncbi:MAG: class I SAM-dependent methyltransferase [Chthoniobacterales bacterium]
MPHSKITTDTFLTIVEKEIAEKKTLHSWKDSFHLLGCSLLAPHKVGSIWPSSQHLARAMLHGVSLKPGDVVVEYGPGTGPFTNLLRHYVTAGVQYLGVEQDRTLYKKLVSRFPGMHFHHGSAEDTADLLKQYKLQRPAFIVSGLPFASMPTLIQERILDATQEVLQDNGIFRTFTYLFSSISPRALHFRKIVLERFAKQHHSTTVIRNFPPARVLSFSHPVRGCNRS